MKRIFFLPIILIGLITQGQVRSDSLQRVINSAAPDSAKVLAMEKLSVVSRFDSSITLAQQAVDLARKTGFRRGEALALNRSGDIYFDSYNYPRALSFYLESLKQYEAIEDLKGMSINYADLGNLYARQSDHETALHYYRGTADLKKKIGEDERSIFFGVGKVHEFHGSLDSALIYYQRAYEYYLTSPGSTRTHFVLIHLGNVHLKKKNHLLAVSYAWMAGSNISHLPPDGIAAIYTHMAEIFMETGARDSAFFMEKKPLLLLKKAMIIVHWMPRCCWRSCMKTTSQRLTTTIDMEKPCRTACSAGRKCVRSRS